MNTGDAEFWGTNTQASPLPPITSQPALSFYPLTLPGSGYLRPEHIPAVQGSSEPQTRQMAVTKSHTPQNQPESTDFTPVCEFASQCNVGPSPDGFHLRKVVSHLFGRNKTSTRMFPESAWVFYCRKHYQRAQYRVDSWPFTQCDLLLETLGRMQVWGHVKSFELRLRRREAMRANGKEDEMAPTRVLASGRRRPIALIAPVPEWLQREVGINKTFDDIRHLVGQIREYLSNFREYETRLKQAQGVSDARLSASPYHERRTTAVRFPDIEILPTFYPSAIEHPQRRSSQEHGHGGSFTTCNERPAIVDGDSAPAAQPHRQRNSRAGGEPRVSTRGAIKKPRDQGADGRT